MNLITSLFGRFQFAPPSFSQTSSLVDSSPVSQEVQHDPRVAFEVPASDDSTIQVVYPCRTRYSRIETECQVYVLFYRDFGKAIRYLEFHGALRREFGSKIPMTTVDIDRREDEIMIDAIAFGKEVLWALRNPVIAPVLDEPLPLAEAHPPASHHDLLVKTGAKPVIPTSDQPLLIGEGTFQASGPMPWKGKDGQIGKPSFAVVIANFHGDHHVYHGSDLQRALRDADVKPGDKIKIAKYPKIYIQVGNRTVQKNVWTVDKA